MFDHLGSCTDCRRTVNFKLPWEFPTWVSSYEVLGAALGAGCQLHRQPMAGWWWLEHDWLIFPEILGMSSSQLTNSFFQRGRYTTYQMFRLARSSSFRKTVSWFLPFGKLIYIYIAIEHGHGKSGVSHKIAWWCSVVLISTNCIDISTSTKLDKT